MRSFFKEIRWNRLQQGLNFSLKLLALKFRTWNLQKSIKSFSTRKIDLETASQKFWIINQNRSTSRHGITITRNNNGTEKKTFLSFYRFSFFFVKENCIFYIIIHYSINSSSTERKIIYFSFHSNTQLHVVLFSILFFPFSFLYFSNMYYVKRSSVWYTFIWESKKKYRKKQHRRRAAAVICVWGYTFFHFQPTYTFISKNFLFPYTSFFHINYILCMFFFFSASEMKRKWNCFSI